MALDGITLNTVSVFCKTVLWFAIQSQDYKILSRYSAILSRDYATLCQDSVLSFRKFLSINMKSKLTYPLTMDSRMAIQVHTWTWVSNSEYKAELRRCHLPKNLAILCVLGSRGGFNGNINMAGLVPLGMPQHIRLAGLVPQFSCSMILKQTNIELVILPEDQLTSYP